MKKIIFFLLVVIFIIFYIKSITFYTKDIEFGIVYKLKIKANKDQIEILKINNKNLDKIIYIKNKEKLRYGYYDIEYVFKNLKKGKILKIKENFFNKYIYNFEDMIDKNYKNFNLRAFIKAIILGNSSFIDKDFMEKFKYLGILHLMVISGLHIYIIRSFLEKYIILDNNIKNIIIWTILTIYSLILGFSTSIKRVYIMNSLDLFFNKKNSKENFLLTILIVMILNVYEIIKISFIFSYLSVFTILYIFPLFCKKIKNKYIQNIFLSILLQIILLPFNYIYFKIVPFLSFIANIILIPITSKFLELIILNLVLNFFEINFFNFLIEYLYISYESLIILLSKISYMSFIIND